MVVLRILWAGRKSPIYLENEKIFTTHMLLVEDARLDC